MRPVVLSIAGSDSCAGAGIQADLKTIEANGGYAVTVITAVTAQNTLGIRRVDPLPADSVAAQLGAVFDDFDVAAVKSGMLVDAKVIGAVSRVLRQRKPRHYVCDPVLRSSSGSELVDDEGMEALVREILPLATLLTPNLKEAEALSGVEVRSLDQAEGAARRIRQSGAGAVLVTGGHLDAAPATDLLVDANGTFRFPGRLIETRHTHGGGCVFSAAIATALARGAELAAAIRQAKEFVAEAMLHGLAVGAGPGPVDPFHGGWRRNGDSAWRGSDET